MQVEGLGCSCTCAGVSAATQYSSRQCADAGRVRHTADCVLCGALQGRSGFLSVVTEPDHLSARTGHGAAVALVTAVEDSCGTRDHMSLLCWRGYRAVVLLLHDFAVGVSGSFFHRACLWTI